MHRVGSSRDCLPSAAPALWIAARRHADDRAKRWPVRPLGTSWQSRGSPGQSDR